MSIVAAMLLFELILFQILFPCRFLLSSVLFVLLFNKLPATTNPTILSNFDTDFNFNFILISLQSITFSISLVVIVFQGYITTQFSVRS